LNKLQRKSKVVIVITLAVWILGWYYAESAISMLHGTGIEIATNDSLPVETKAKNEFDFNMETVFSEYIQSHNRKIFSELAELMAESLVESGEEFDLPPVYLLALAQVESDFNYMAVSKKDCVGLLQINPKVWVKDDSNKDGLKVANIAHTVASLYSPEINIRAGAHILRVYFKQGQKKGKENPLEYALTRYFGGVKNSHYAKFKSAVGNFYIYFLAQGE